MVSDLAVWIAGLLWSAAADVPDFRLYCRLWDHDSVRSWERLAGDLGWAHQTFGWGDPDVSDA